MAGKSEDNRYYIVQSGAIFRRELLNDNSGLIKYPRGSRIRLSPEEAAYHGTRVSPDTATITQVAVPTTAEEVVDRPWASVLKILDQVGNIEEVVDILTTELANRRRRVVIQYANAILAANGMEPIEAGDEDIDDSVDDEPDSESSVKSTTTTAPKSTSTTTPPRPRGRPRKTPAA